MTLETAASFVPAFINVQVTAVPSGKPGTYTIKCLTDPICVSGPTIVNFQLVAPTPADVKFLSKIVKHPSDKHQLSDPSVSADSKMLTLNNVHSWIGDIKVDLFVTDKHMDKDGHNFDPQIRNEPQ